MLKEKGYKKWNLHERILAAAHDHLITEEMATWANEVRLDANAQRHADEAAPLPTEADAGTTVDFAMALAEFMFVLPARVKRGRKINKEATSEERPDNPTQTEKSDIDPRFHK